MKKTIVLVSIVLALAVGLVGRASLARAGVPLSIAAAGTSYDGPSQLPISTVASSMAATPSPGAVISARAGDDLQGALDRAQCGDTVELQAGAVFTGTFRLRARNCDNSHWIIVRTSSPDAALPTEGQRLTPCYAGVTSLPGRPQYACDKAQNVLAKVVAGQVNAVVFETGANHYRLTGLEVTRPRGTKGAVTLLTVEHGGTANHIVLDRSWLHGTAEDETKVGFKLSGMSYGAVVDSYFSDFHCTSITGSCIEAHAVGGGIGNYQDGPYKIDNNFLESSGQAILFGGGPATKTPSDITIHFNHFFKPWQWMNGHLPYQGGDSGHPFVVNHHLELKNAKRVLIEGNLMENVWGGFTEAGEAILLTPKNQHTKSGDDLCPICAVTDVTIRYTHIIHAAGGIVIGTNLSGNGEGGAAKAGTRFSIHDIVMDDISRKYKGGGRLFVVKNGWPVNPVNTITINHITGFADPEGGILTLGNRSSNPEMYGFVFTNNIIRTGRYPVWNAGGEQSCAYSGTPAQKVANCFSTYTFKENLLVEVPSQYPAPSWPAGNLFASDINSVGFVRTHDANGGNYELYWSSPYKRKGSDGKDLGADILGLKKALAGVE